MEATYDFNLTQDIKGSYFNAAVTSCFTNCVTPNNTQAKFDRSLSETQTTCLNSCFKDKLSYINSSK